MLTFKNLKMCFRKIPLSQIQTQNYSKFVSTNKGNFNQILTNRKRSSGVDLSYYDMLNQTNWLNGTSIVYFENLYEEWKKEPNSVSKEWNTYFKNMEAEEDFEISNKNKPILENGMINSRIGDHLTVQGIIRSFQIRGHLKSRLDPLDMPYRLNTEIAEDIKNLSIESFNLGNSDLDKVFKLPETTFIGGANEKELPLREIIKRLEDSYCKSIGVEYSYLSDRDSLQWIRRKFETPNIRTMSNVEKKVLLNRLIRSTNFEEYLAKKWSSEKRFGLEGCEVLIPAIKTIVDVCSEQGLEKYIFGMPHRGRLNVIANVLGKPLEQIFAQFDVSHGDTSDNSGDVKYHLGLHNEIVNKFSGKDISMSLVANPSHLEAVGPVVLGKVKADQFYNNDTDGSKTMGIILHGDAAFSGQGVVYETLHLSDLNMYKTHGVIHIVVNNQIGFTTDPRDARSSIYCTDVAKVINAPILHVNADDPEAVMHVSKVAAEWRMKKKRDIVIDLVCYRRNGHNETDEPQFTQPCMYQKIRNLPKLLKQYSTKLLNENVITLEEYQKQIEGYQKQLDAGHDAAKNAPHIHTNRDWLDSPWNNFFDNQDPMKIKETGISLDTLHKIGNVFNDIPKSKVNYYKGLLRILNNRKKMMDIETFDWAMCEAFAFGSLLLDKVHVRLSGQDVERGTFSHRHHVIMDQDNLGKKYVPLDNISLDQEKYTVCNSSLSEFAVMGFELGFSMHNPNSLIIWEAQFGDFVNNAQCIIDQFLSSGQAKWIRQCGLVLLLPHGMEGM
ncbi:Alpha-ketoglutarate dehydrogenase, partial [Intoshia linei]